MIRILIAIAFLVVVSIASALKPSDNGVFSSPETLLQGFSVQYSPGIVPGLVFYWFTYDEVGNQAWFISDLVPINDSQSEQVVDIFKPICTFVNKSKECIIGDPVGVLALSSITDDRINVRFGIKEIEGFTSDCSDMGAEPLPSPRPPPLGNEFVCQSTLKVARISVKIPELQ